MARVETTIHWLHLSDFHFDAGKSWDRDRSVKALLKYLAERKKDGWRPDLVFATGDFANRGKREEFDQAILFFRKLAEVLELYLARDLFLVPGNHDVDRGAKGPLDDAMLGSLAAKNGAEQQEEIAKVLGHAPTMRLLGSRLAEYYSFTERLLGSARRTEADRPWRTDVREVRGMEVAVLQLNSAWCCGKEKEKGELLVGAHQVEEALAQAGGASLRFVLVHHPADYLADGDAGCTRGLTQDRGGAHFLLRGHLHENDLQLRVNPDGGLVELAAGAVYQGTGWPKRFLIGSYDLGNGAGTVELLTYSDRGAGFWTVDATSYRDLQDGQFHFELPREMAGGGKAAATRKATIIDRYRAAVAAVHGQMRFIGFPAAAAGQRPNVAVQDLFVPLHLGRGRIGADGQQDTLNTETLLELLEPGQGKAGRFVVLGEPGSGKTTLCRFAAIVFAGESTHGEARNLQLPLFLPFRDYMRRRREKGDCSLIEYLADQAKNHLQVAGADYDLFESALENGKAVLLLDGLDEVGSPRERVDMRDRVKAFCRQYPKLPVLLTSRFAGYGDAPLPEGDFTRLELKSFSGNDLRIFVANWYAVQEPNDPQARANGIADLVAVFGAEPQVRALAGNPLLATLIALVHRTEAKLPGERAKLYELVVRTLLETWPALARREFLQIDAGLQRTFLEDFALGRQQNRSYRDTEVVFNHTELVDSLAGLIARQQGKARLEDTRHIAEAWVEHLATGTGLIVEQQPRVFAFLHLSLLEYLAACALDRRDETLDEAVARLHGEAAWREVLLLAVGRHATDALLLGRLSHRLHNAESWEFLLLCLREEAAFDEITRCKILDAAAKSLLSRRAAGWTFIQEVVRTLERFSVRHGKATREWRQETLKGALGEELCAVVALSLEETREVLEALEARGDRAWAAVALLEFWPGSEVGAWAASRADEEAARTFLASAPAELSVARALASCEPGARLAASASLIQLERAAHLFHSSASAAGELAARERPGGKGLPRQVGVHRFALILDVLPKWPRPPRGANPVEGLRYFAQDFARDFARDFAHDFVLDYTRDFTQHFAQDFSRYFTRDFARDFARDIARDFTQYFSKEFTLEFARGLSRYFGRYFARYFILDFNYQAIFNPLSSFSGIPVKGVEHEGPAIAAKAEDRRVFATYIATGRHESRDFAARVFFDRRTAEAWIAMVTTADKSPDEAAAYLSYRLQNVSLLYLWPALDQHLPIAPAPEQLALYFQLGWTQSTTTHEWPATPRWIALMKADPPAHWLPRAQWHLCWLLHDPSVASHQTAFNEALREGLGDADPGRLAVAQTLEKVIGFYP